VLLQTQIIALKNKKIMKKEQILGIVRHALTAIGGSAVILGYYDESTVTQIIGVLMTAIGFVWSVVDKNK
jgi:hypothetical protein